MNVERKKDWKHAFLKLNTKFSFVKKKKHGGHIFSALTQVNNGLREKRIFVGAL